MAGRKDDEGRVDRVIERRIAERGRELFGARRWRDPIVVPLELEPTGEGEWRLKTPLDELADHALREAAAEAAPVRQGTVYCYRCESASCEHAAPARSTEVFQGYGQTGQPQWVDLGQALLAERHPEVDRLYERRPYLVSQFQTGRDLKRRQLTPFGRSSKSYDVLAQVIAGYYRIGRGDAASNVALTLQAVEHRGPRGGLRLQLNVIGRTAEGDDAYPLLLESLGEQLFEPVRKARSALADLQILLRPPAKRQSRSLRSSLLGRVPGIMRTLARDLTARERRRGRRTRHADERRRQSRPIPAAVREALKSTLERTLIDEREATVIVIGRKNRVHVFATDGRLVTSLTLEPDAIDKRVRGKRWRPATTAERDDFLARLRAAGSGAAADDTAPGQTDDR